MTPEPSGPEPFTKTYRAAMAVCRPIAWWGRLTVEGEEFIPRSGPTLIVGNHDSQMDPVVIGMSAIRRRQIRALAKSSLWSNPLLARVLNGMRQIPIERAMGDAGALVNAIAALRDGRLHRDLPRGDDLRRPAAPRAQRRRPPGPRGPGGPPRLLRGHRDAGHRPLPEAPEPPRQVLRAGLRTDRPVGVPEPDRGAIGGRDP